MHVKVSHAAVDSIGTPSPFLRTRGLESSMDAAVSERPRILCVDDEAHALEGLELMIGSQYEVHTAPSGEAALTLMLTT